MLKTPKALSALGVSLAVVLVPATVVVALAWSDSPGKNQTSSASAQGDATPTADVPGYSQVSFRNSPFLSIKDLMDGTEAVLYARVEAIVEYGATTGEDLKIQFRELQLGQIDVLDGSLTDSSKVTLLQEGRKIFPASSAPSGRETILAYTPNGMKWAQVGDEIIVGVRAATAKDTYRLVGDQSLFYLVDGTLASSLPESGHDHLGPFLESIVGLSVDDLRNEIDQVNSAG